VAFLAVASCAPPAPNPNSGDAVTQDSHTRFFPITNGTNHALGRATLDGGSIACETCHTHSTAPQATFADFDCISCHDSPEPNLDRMHQSPVVATKGTYAYTNAACYACHADGTCQPFDHLDRSGSVFTDGCATCHDQGRLYAPSPGPMADPTHPAITSDCGACHTYTTGSCQHDWTIWKKNATTAPTKSDPNQDVTVNALIPTYSLPYIQSFDPQVETLQMTMHHDSMQIPPGADGGIIACTDCHTTGGYYPGVFHLTLSTLNLPQPALCADCHPSSIMPIGFVGPAPTASNIARSPSSGEMKHDAVDDGGVPLVTDDCSVCHLAPTDPVILWSTSATYHSALTAAGKKQPSVCLDCHANTRPAAVTFPVGATRGTTTFDHVKGAQFGTLGECSTCHTKTTADWSGGKFHATNPAPGTCVDCHEGERPTTAANPVTSWTGSYTVSPFDDVTTSYPNGQTITHGAGLDCSVCHSGPGSESAGPGSWTGGKFVHGPGTLSATTCGACHNSQRPTMVLNGFDHSVDGPGDCYGCHQQTVKTGSYVYYMADWDGGVRYPGDTLISSSDQFINVTEYVLNRGTGGFVNSMSQTQATLYNAMQHRAGAVLDAGIDCGPSGSPNRDTCWICHTWIPAADGGHTITTFANGQFHGAIADAGHPQPTSGCDDCHLVMVPSNIVELDGGIDTRPMDHAAALTGGAATKVLDLDCSTCHANPGGSWNDGNFHKNLKNKTGQAPAECVGCHYPLMADSARADVDGGTMSVGGTSYAMKHRSGQVTVQACDMCHDRTTLLNSALSGVASSQWAPGLMHSKVSPQPTACIDCHTVTVPTVTTQSMWSYTLPMGATSTNQGQWLNHNTPIVVGKDCVICHATDATSSTMVSTPWSKSDKVHITGITPNTCQRCHGLLNGLSSMAGASNNLPQGLTSSSVVSTAAMDSTTGVPAGTLDLITHDDVNVTGKECNVCHTQAGISGSGNEWAQAKFHTGPSGVLGLAAGTRCDNCHANLRPTMMVSGFDHSTGITPGQDCGDCHIWPGTGTTMAANWLGATGIPLTVTLNPWTSGSVITSETVTFLHPAKTTFTSCAQCHLGVADYKKIVNYNHDGLNSMLTINGMTPAPTPNFGNSIYDPAANPTFCVHCHNTGSPYIINGASTTVVGTLNATTTVSTTASTSALVVGMIVTGSGIPTTTTTTRTFTADVTAGSATVTTATAVSLSAGSVISGFSGIPAGDTVLTSVTNATTFTLKTAATASGTGLTLTDTRTVPLTVTIRTISPMSFTLSTAATASASGVTLTVTHPRTAQAAIGNHQTSTSTEDCTSCHYAGTQRLTPPTPGQFNTGNISGG
jgi:hypothetical protein